MLLLVQEIERRFVRMIFLILLLSWLIPSLFHDRSVHCINLCSFKMVQSYISLAVSNRYKKKVRQNSDMAGIESTIFPESGGVEAIEKAYKAVNQAKTVVVLKTACNTVVCGYQINNSSRVLQTPMSSTGYYPLSTSQYILITGLVGDCREVLKYAAQLYSNHLFDLDTVSCTSSYLAKKISLLLQKGSGDRPFACHMFIVDTRPGIDSAFSALAGPQIFEITAAGAISVVEAGVIGKGMLNGRRILGEYSSSNIQLEDAKKLINHIISGETSSRNTDTSASASSTSNITAESACGGSASSSNNIDEDCPYYHRHHRHHFIVKNKACSHPRIAPPWDLRPGIISIVRELSVQGTTFHIL